MVISSQRILARGWEIFCGVAMVVGLSFTQVIIPWEINRLFRV